MDNSLSIEEKLRRLVPPSLSETAQVKLEETIDRLAGVEPHCANTAKAENKKFWPWKAAAAVALLAAPVVMYQMQSAPQPDALLAIRDVGDVSDLAPELVVLKTSCRIDACEDDGLIIPTDGAAPHYRYRYSITNEEQVRDAETGTVITLRQPQQEVLTIPVTQF